jgi:hypothetical protein
MNILKTIKEAAVKLWENPSLFLPAVFNLASSYMLVAIFLIIAALTIGIPAISSLLDPNLISEQLVGDTLTMVLIFALISIIAWALIASFFEGILYSMLKMKKIRFNLDGKKFFGRILGINCIIWLGAIISSLIIVLLAIVLVKISLWFSVLILILIIAMIFALSLFMLSRVYVVADDAGVFEALGKSCRVSLRKYLKLLGLIILLMIIVIAVSLILSFIPILGSIINAILLVTFGRVCIYLFALDNAKK